MTPTTKMDKKTDQKTERAPLGTAQLHDIATLSGPCLTFLIPSYRPAAQDGSPKVVLKDLLERARQQLAQGSHEAEIPGLLRPVEEILERAELERGGPGFVVFRSGDKTLEYHGLPILQGRVSVSSYPLSSYATIAPLLESALAPQEFYILGLSQKTPRLVEYRQGVCEERELPQDLPENPSAMFDSETAERALNRAGRANTPGHAQGAMFGTDTEREKALKHVHDFFKSLDRALQSVVEDRPVLLAGVRNEMIEFRKTSTHLELLATEIEGAIDRTPLPELAESAAAAVRDHVLHQGAEALDRFEAVSAGDQKLQDPLAIVEAAHQGRVHQLCVRRNSTVMGKLPIPLNTAHVGEEDLVNAAAALTLAKGGAVFVVAEEKMDPEQPLAAILRY